MFASVRSLLASICWRSNSVLAMAQHGDQNQARRKYRHGHRGLPVRRRQPVLFVLLLGELGQLFGFHGSSLPIVQFACGEFDSYHCKPL
jgi:hypothetical protein